ncbi:MAG: hypothetical protein GF310_10230 [candidate division Zixibacteria bacterium]|nr:hypothetical protein [candidate division Zixibacteria bacterium]
MTGRQKVGILLLIAAMFIVMGTFNQARAEDRENYLVRGSWSMQFGIVRDFTLTSFNGGLISAKRHLSPNTAFRFGLSLRGDVGDNSSETSRSYEQPGGGEEFTRTSDGNTSNLILNISTQLMFYSTIEKSVNLYFGFGPNFNYSRDKDEFDLEYTYEDIPDRDGFENRYMRSWSAGFLGSWGVELFASKKISFIAEYGARIEYYSLYRETNSEEYVDETGRFENFSEDSHDFRIISDAVKFGISLYFN